MFWCGYVQTEDPFWLKKAYYSSIFLKIITLLLKTRMKSLTIQDSEKIKALL